MPRMQGQAGNPSFCPDPWLVLPPSPPALGALPHCCEKGKRARTGRGLMCSGAQRTSCHLDGADLCLASEG